MRGSRILATRNHRIFIIQSTFFKPYNKLEIKTQKKADATYKSTKNIQRARSGDNLSSTTGTDERAAPQTTVVTPKCPLVPSPTLSTFRCRLSLKLKPQQQRGRGTCSASLLTEHNDLIAFLPTQLKLLFSFPLEGACRGGRRHLQYIGMDVKGLRRAC